MIEINLIDIKRNFILAHEELSKKLDQWDNIRPCKLCKISLSRQRTSDLAFTVMCSYCTMTHSLYRSAPCMKMQTCLTIKKRKKIDINKAETTQEKIDYHNIVRRKSFHKKVAKYLRTLSPKNFALDKMHIIGEKVWKIDAETFKFETYKVKNHDTS